MAGAINCAAPRRQPNRAMRRYAVTAAAHVVVPEKVEEQQEIADCLSAADHLIDVQSEKLAAVRAHKKGLMQQLFPSAAEGEV